ncbi:LysM peptidoglycan-binding domain-containing protein [Macrococcus sp. EM39E]|uniref:LysM peptidoglycan-binding domain-containing protein n=1 Tax=Macrococcus animalis TaxID=3395467 RepID=UPI0039BF0000
MKKLATITTMAILATSVVTTQVDAKEHTVGNGESLWTIADKYDTTIQKIKKINKLESNLIVPDQKLEVLVNGKYEVKDGDTLSKIAHKVDIKVWQLKKWNKIKSSKELKEGQLLIVEKKVKNNTVKVAPVSKSVAAPVTAPKADTTETPVQAPVAKTTSTETPAEAPVQAASQSQPVQQKAPVQQVAPKAQPVQQAPVQQAAPKAAVKQTAAPAGNSSVDAHLRVIMQRESGGNPNAVNPAGYYGLFQFSPQTWAAVGGTGNPAQASEAEQWKRARMLYTQHGAGHWTTAY